MIPMKTLTLDGKTYEIVDELARNAIGSEREDIRRSCSTAITNTVEGAPIQVADATDNQLLGLRVFGNTNQFTTTGKNKIDMTSFEFNDSHYTHIIPNDDPAVIELWNLLKTNIGKSIVVSMTTTGTVSGIAIGTIRFYNANNEAICILVPGVEHIIKELPETYGVVYIYGSSTGASVKNIQVEFGSTATAYEPYTGGIPSPNPDYPQDLESAGASGAIKIRSSGKNLFPVKDVEFVRDHRIPLEFNYPAGIYTFSAVITSTDIDDADCAVMFYKGDEWIDSVYMPRSTAGERTSGRKIMKDSFDLIRFYAARSYGKSEGDTCNMFDIQLELGDVATGFEPYKATNASVTTPNGLSGIPVTTGGNYRDSNGQQWVCDEIDFERGVYIQRIKSKVIDGKVAPTTFAEGINGGTVFGWSYDAFGMADIVRDRSPKLCDKLLHPDNTTPGSYKSCKIGQYGFNTDGSADSFLIMNVGTFETAGDVATWLNENPITIMYALANPVEINLTEALIVEYKKLYTNYRNTVLVNDYTAHMEAVYNVDTEIYLNSRVGPTDEQVQEAINTWLDANGDSIIPDVSGGNGKSAYEYAKEAGYTGTEEEFAQKLATSIPTVPTKTSQLTNDSGFLTSAPVTSVNGQTGAVEITIPTVPTKTSQLTNDSGFLTSAPVTSVNGQTGAVKITIPTVPTKTSQLTNDSGFLTSAPVTSVNGQTGAVKITIPTVPTALKNPNALIINGTSYDGSAKADITEIVNTMIETKLNALTRAEEVAF